MCIGQALGAYEQNRTANRQDKASAKAIRAQALRQQQADALVRAAVQTQANSNPNADRMSSLNKYMAQINGAQGAATSGLHQVGNVSDRYTQEASGAEGDIGNYARTFADLFSRTDAPLLQRQREGIAFGRLGSDINRVGMGSDSDRYLSELKLRGIRNNPWTMGFASALTGAEKAAAAADGGG